MRSPKRRTLGVLLGAALVLAACGSDDSTETSSTAAEATSAATDAVEATDAPAESAAPADSAAPASGEATKVAIITSGPAADLGWNQGIISSAQKLEAEGLIELTVVEQGYDITAEDTVQAASDLAEAGNRIIIAHSFNYGEPLKTMVEDYPDVLFAYAGGFGDNSLNLADYDQPFYEPAFLAGILAGALTKTGKLGVTGGFDIPVCHAMGEAFAEGAKLTYTGGDVELIQSWIGSWGDVAKTKEAVIAMADEGADAFIPCGVEAGTIEGAKETGTMVIGYVMDQSTLAPENILASVVWNLDTVISAMVADVTSGAAPPAPYYAKGFEDGGTSLVLNPDFPTEIPAEALALYEEYTQKMLDGTFTVTYVPE